ncbi:DinB family protein [Longibacter sp.]|uniref:DinB family protein n=1 Tax=Longibacter sp. TaxID=2045415 RepID=UPI003EB792D3
MTDIDLAAETDRLQVAFDDIRALVTSDDPSIYRAVPEVSDWSPAQHLYHVLGATGRMLKAATLLANGAVNGDEPSLTAAGKTILESEIIPRGVGQAPEKTHPPSDLSPDDLETSYARAAGKMETAVRAVDANAPEDRGLEHHAWGVLTAPQWLRAARVHCRHHLKIVEEIRAHADT